MKTRRLTSLSALLVLAVTAALTAGCGSPANSPANALQGRLLSVADLPAGWSAAPASSNSGQTNAPCLSSLPANPLGSAYASASFVEGTSIPGLHETLSTGASAQQGWHSINRELAGCRTATVTISGKKVTAAIRPLAFPRVASASSAYAWTLTVAGIRIGVDIILFEAGPYTGYLIYSDLGSPATATVKAFADAAAAKAANGSTAPVTGEDSIASAPVRTAHTSLGNVAYRVIGSGPPLVLIAGYGSTMEVWDPRVVDALAVQHRVVIFDNAGIGGTQALPGPLTIDAMASQTSALITALDLGRPDVLGWSMGTMIAQALAVLHPDQVNRLVLCAGYPGNGAAAQPSQQAINALNSGDMSVLWPAGQTAARNAYLVAISSYPAAPGPAAGIITDQAQAVTGWWAGDDLAGKRTASIAEPTLIADGTADQLDPVANSHTLDSLITGAKLVLYPDAGHSFLFQDEAAFVPVIESFLGS
jgi:pimeloyl-ACP methyl ester carboxylesterase